MLISGSFSRVLCAVGSASLLALLTGCGLSADAPGAISGGGVAGAVHGGQQPITGATIQLMAPGQSGYGSAPTVLSTSTTDANGGFSMPAYTCPANTGMVYLVVNGGNSGSGINPLIGEAAIVGPCSSAPSAFVRISEVTTVAAAYTLAPFAAVTATATNIGTSATNLTGLNNTYAVANLIAPNATGMAAASPYVPGILVPPILLPQAQVNMMANILASCVNTAGSLASGTPCAQLQGYATYNGVAPADTFQAALNIARQPATNVSGLYGLATANAPFQPALSIQPNDLTLLVGYAGTIAYNSAVPAGSGKIALDAAGDIYTLSSTSLVEITPGGTLTATPLIASCSGTGIAISKSGNVYVACGNSNTVQQYSPAGLLLATIASTDLVSPGALAFDAAGNLWVANSASLAEFNAAGTEVAGSPYAVSSAATDIAISPAAIWSNPGQGGLLRIDNTTHAVLSYPQTSAVVSVGVDHANDLWAANYATDLYSDYFGAALELSDAGGAISPTSGYPGGSNTNIPQGIALDGGGAAYTTSRTTHSTGNPAIVTAYSPTGAILPNSVHPTYNQVQQLTTPMTASPGKPAVDGSGNLWVSGAIWRGWVPDNGDRAERARGYAAGDSGEYQHGRDTTLNCSGAQEERVSSTGETRSCFCEGKPLYYAGMGPSAEPDLLSSSRRRFLTVTTAAGLGQGLFPGALLALSGQSGGSSGGSGAQDAGALPKITAAMIDDAAVIAGITIDDAQKAMMLDGLNSQRESALEIRKLPLPNSVAPAVVFDPVPGGWCSIRCAGR